MKVKLILPALDESKSPFWRPIKYSLFPPLGLATLAAHFSADDELELVDQHVEELVLDDRPDIVLIQVYITNAYRAYRIADHYRSKGSLVLLGGLHVTALPDEAQKHADVIFLGPADEALPRFLRDLKNGSYAKRYVSAERQIKDLPKIRRDLIKRNKYLVPNSLVVSRGCPHHCSFCYKDSFYAGGKSFYTTTIDSALEEINSLPGKHLYFLDDHLFGNYKFASNLFDSMIGMNRVFQAAATVESILTGDIVEKAQAAGLRSLFVGFETLSENNLRSSNKTQNLKRNYEQAVKKLHDLGIMINGSFVFGMDDDDKDVFSRTVDWATRNSMTTCTFHIMTPYPGTELFKRLEAEKRIRTYEWNRYTTREAVYQPRKMSKEELESGYSWAYTEFYKWNNIVKSSLGNQLLHHRLKHFAYTAGWKKFESLWNILIKLNHLNDAIPLLERILTTDKMSK
ncbi:MAG TPA: radical SAM protein [Spirochaetia bacterium]|nr:radical SAM protein [Spirochaetia bacterium]